MKISKKDLQNKNKSKTCSANASTCRNAEDKDKYGECKKSIRSAIDALGNIAKDDILAREAIANLSVVLFDLQP